MIVNPDEAIMYHCSHEYKALQDHMKTVKADTAKEEEKIKSLQAD
jgi:hypothetical protein